MRYRKNDACDQRRRRVLIEENLGEMSLDREAPLQPDADSSCGSAGHFLPSYTDAALADQQSPITAVIPRRRWTVALLLLSGLTAIAGIEAAYGKLNLWPREMWASDFRAVDARSPGGLAAWFCSLMLAVAAFQGFQIYRLRRHKTDDYRGRYRVWLWVPILLLFVATCVATDIHRDLANLANGFANITAPAESGPLWPLIYCALWTLVSLRLAFEVRQSRASLVSLLVATCCYFTAAFAVLFADLAVAEMSEITYVMATTSIVMSGHLATFLTVAIYGRHVYLDSQGMLPARARKTGRQKSQSKCDNDSRSGEGNAASKSSSRKRVRETVIPMNAAKDGSVSSDSSGSPTRKRPTQAKKRNSMDEASPQFTVKTDAEPQASLEESDDNRKLSKAERRRLRKQKRREQRRKAA